MPSQKLEMVNVSKDVSLKVARYEPDGPLRGALLVVHGFGEHIGMYAEFASFFSENGFVCVLYDQRGHGEMPNLSNRARKRHLGIAKNYDNYLDDVKAVRDKMAEWYPDLPVTLFGHSMGGNIALNYLLKRSEDDFTKAVIETPWLRLSKPKPGAAVMAARTLGKVSHRFAACDTLDIGALTREQDKVEATKNDHLYHNRMSLRIFTQVTEAGEYAIENAHALTLKTLLLSASGDRVVSPVATREFYKKAGENVIFYEEPGGYHALHNDVVRAQIFERILGFLDE